MPGGDNSLLNNGLLILGVVALIWGGLWIIQRTRRDLMPAQPEKPEDLLRGFESALRRGEMSEEEYQRVRQSLERKRTGTPSPAPAPAADQPAAPPPVPAEVRDDGPSPAGESPQAP
jgi:hypothetical protein